jgi:Serine dehydrogenase proteinase
MPTWGEMLAELGRLREKAEAKAQAGTARSGELAPVDVLRRKYTKQLSELTGRATIVYETAWLGANPEITSAEVGVGQIDMQGFMEAVSNIELRELDLIIHSPGGSPEAADSVMAYLWTRFDHIRAIVPHAAMSAATMMALACDEVVMGAHSQLGPIDPQITIPTPEGPRSAPAQAVIDQFERAKEECKDTDNVAAWTPILRGTYIPGLLSMCDDQRALAEEFVATNLEAHMFAGEDDAAEKAKKAAAWFADHKAFRSHSRRVSRDDARGVGIKVSDLEDDQALQDAVLSVHHAVDHTFASTGAFKIIENDLGRTYIQSRGPQLIFQGPIGPGPGMGQGPVGPFQAGPGPGGGRPPGPPRKGGRRKKRR